MTRQQVIIAIAIINKVSKQICEIISTDRLSSLTDDMKTELHKIKRYGSEIERYFKNSPCDPFVNGIDKISSPDIVWSLLSSEKKSEDNKPDDKTLALFREYAVVVDMLKSYSESYKQMVKEAKYANLIDELSNDKALAVMQRAVYAGLLTPTFKLDGSLSKIQVKVLAFALSCKIGLPRKGRYTIFMRQWDWTEGHISGINVPEQRFEELNAIKNVFPDVDYTSINQPKENAFFKVECEDDKILALYMSLITNEYIDLSTAYTDFLSVFGRGNLKGRKPVNWIKSQRQLSYFIYIVFDNSEKYIWQKTRNCFTVNGKTPNKGSLRSGLGKLDANLGGLAESYDPVLYGIAKMFLREITPTVSQETSQEQSLNIKSKTLTPNGKVAEYAE